MQQLQLGAGVFSVELVDHEHRAPAGRAQRGDDEGCCGDGAEQGSLIGVGFEVCWTVLVDALLIDGVDLLQRHHAGGHTNNERSARHSEADHCRH